jgi:DNA-binding CsgD family transcriptional regulator
VPRKRRLTEAELFDASRLLREPASLDVFNRRTAGLWRRLFDCDAGTSWTLTGGRLSWSDDGLGVAVEPAHLEGLYGEHMRVDPKAIQAGGLEVNHISDIYRRFSGMGELYARVWMEWRCDHQVSACLFEDDVFAGVASCIQRLDTGDFSALDVDAMHALYPHLQAGYLACAALARETWFGTSLARVVEAYPDPLFVLAVGQERPVYANREARRWMQSPEREGGPRIPLIAGSRIAQRALSAVADGAVPQGEQAEILELPDWPRLGLERPRLVVLHPSKRPAADPLTGRQRQVLACAARALRAEDAAKALGVTRSTLQTHLKQIYRRLGVSGLSEAVVMARLGATI